MNETVSGNIILYFHMGLSKEDYEKYFMIYAGTNSIHNFVPGFQGCQMIGYNENNIQISYFNKKAHLSILFEKWDAEEGIKGFDFHNLGESDDVRMGTCIVQISIPFEKLTASQIVELLTEMGSVAEDEVCKAIFEEDKIVNSIYKIHRHIEIDSINNSLIIYNDIVNQLGGSFYPENLLQTPDFSFFFNSSYSTFLGTSKINFQKLLSYFLFLEVALDKFGLQFVNGRRRLLDKYIYNIKKDYDPEEDKFYEYSQLTPDDSDDMPSNIKEQINAISGFKSVYLFRVLFELEFLKRYEMVGNLAPISFMLERGRKLQEKIQTIFSSTQDILDSYLLYHSVLNLEKQTKMAEEQAESTKIQAEMSKKQAVMAEKQTIIAESQTTMTEHSLQHQFHATMLSNAFELLQIFFVIVGILQVSVILYQAYYEENTPLRFYIALFILLASIIFAVWVLERRKKCILAEIAERRYKAYWTYSKQDSVSDLTDKQRRSIINDTINDLDAYTLLPNWLGGKLLLKRMVERWNHLWEKKYEYIESLLSTPYEATNVEQISKLVNKKLRYYCDKGKGSCHHITCLKNGDFQNTPPHLRCDEEDVIFISSYPVGNRDIRTVGRSGKIISKEEAENFLKTNS